MANVALIHDGDCPNIAKARVNLLRSFVQANHPARWVEWERCDPASPPISAALVRLPFSWTVGMLETPSPHKT